MGRAREAGLISVDFHDPRTFSTDRHLHVDDRPYGGGPGMVMQMAPVAAALRSIETPGRMLAMAPNGRAASQDLMRELAKEEDVTILCGRYEGFDQRLYDVFPLEPVGVGEIVLNGGEAAAMCILEAVARLVPGFMGKEESGDDESFSDGLLEYPHYTRPPVFEGFGVPEVLESGDHGAIAAWRRRASLAATLARRPEMLDSAPLNRDDGIALCGMPFTSVARNISFCLVHFPVILEGHRAGTSSLTNLDVHDISRMSRTYGLGAFYLATPIDAQRALVEDMLQHWQRAGQRGHADRAEALRMAHPVDSVDSAIAAMTEEYGVRPYVIATSASWPKKVKTPLLSCADVRRIAAAKPVLLLLGTAGGLAPQLIKECDGILRPLRFTGYNHLSVRSAAAILADRIVGDFF